MPSLICPRCRLSILPRVAYLLVDHCPRCIARDRIAVPMADGPASGDAEVRLDGLNWRAPSERFRGSPGG